MTVGLVSDDGSLISTNDWTLGSPDANGYRILTLSPSAQRHGTVNLTLQASTGGSQLAEQTFQLTVNALADAPDLSVAGASGLLGAAIPLVIVSDLHDLDGSEVLSIEISGVPSGASLNKGSSLGNGVWSLTSAQLTGLTVTPPVGSSQDFDLTVKAIAIEGSNGDMATSTQTLSVKVDAAPDDLSVNATIAENSSTATPIAVVNVSDPDEGEANLVNLSDWQQGAGTPSLAGWSTSYLGESQWTTTTGSDGTLTTVLETGQTNTGQSGGGGLTNSFAVDPTKAYKFTIRFRKYDLANHNIYFGTSGACC